MGISQKIRAAMKLLKEIDHEFRMMTRKNKCIPGTRKRGRGSKKGKTETKKSVRFNKPLTEEPEVEPEVEPEIKSPEEPVETSPEETTTTPENPFEESLEEEPVEEPEGETNPVDDGLTKA